MTCSTPRSRPAHLSIYDLHIDMSGVMCRCGRHDGFTEEELDFIINYDIKYRMGRDVEGEGE